MKIATVTYHDGINFGAYWQAKCLVTYLEEIGHEVYIVDYKPDSLKYNELKTLFFTKRPVLLIKNFIKFLKFRRCQKRTFNLVSVEDLNKFELNTLVFGADEIWNFTNPLIGLDLTFFGKINALGVRKVSYAPSFGTVENKPLPTDVLEALRGFSSITTRDKNSHQIIRDHLDLTTDIVCDPVFLSEIKHNNIKHLDKTIVIYSTGLPSVFVEQIKSYANKNGLDVLAIGYRIPGVKSIISLSPNEFIDYLASSHFVVTSMFHGVMFSLKFEKDFLIYEDLYRKNKLETVVEKLELKERFVNENNVHSKIQLNVDYTTIKPKLSEWISFSQKKLKETVI